MRFINKVYANTIKLLPVPLLWRRAIDHWLRFGEWPNISAPKKFSEKLLWRAVYDRRPIMAFTCDKLAMKEYALARSNDIKVPRTIWAGTDLEETSEIPSSEFESGWVLKPNHGCGHVVIGRGSPQIKNRDIAKWWATYGAVGTSGWGGWAYSQARKVVFFEELIGDGATDLIDYKFYIFNGRFALLQLITGRGGVKRRYLLDSDWHLLYSAEDSAGNFLPEKPCKFRELIGVAEDIGAEFDFMRVDLYFVEGDIWFSELTPYPSTTRDSRPEEIDRMLGEVWQLPQSYL